MGIALMTRSALIAALYATIAYLSAPLQFAFFQFRLSEAFCVLPIFMPEAIIGLTLGCAIANYITGAVVWDVIFGSLATLIGALLARVIGKLIKSKKLIFLATLPTVLANAVIVPFVIRFAYGATNGYWFLFATVAVGELATATILGALLYSVLDKRGLIGKL